jgi:hypothetical protein
MGKAAPIDMFEYSVTYFDGSCLVTLSQRLVSFYSAGGQMFNKYYKPHVRPQEEITTCEPDVFAGGLFGVSYCLAQCIPAWLLRCERVGERYLEVFTDLPAANRAVSGAVGYKFAIVATEDCKIAYALYRTPEYVASFEPGVQTLLL